MRVTTLIENERLPDREDLVAEFGLSLHIEFERTRILFDAGASPAFIGNAERMGIDLGAVDLAVLSHHHFDHGGGLEAFLEVNPNARVHLRAAEISERQFRAFGVIRHSVGIDTSLLERFPERFFPLSESTEIAPGATVLTHIPDDLPRPAGNKHLYVIRDGQIAHDSFDHELVLVVREGDGIVVFTGCSHSGILNMIDGVAQSFPELPIRAVFGGFHLIGLPLFGRMAASRAEVRTLAGRILDVPVERVYTGHCTGKRAYGVLQEVMGDRLAAFPTGTVIEV